MKHIERFSEPWNSLPSHKVTLLESAIAVFKSSLGKFWPIYLFFILFILFLPVGIFRNEIRLDPSLFVTEWLKLIIEGIIFFFVLEIVRHRSLSFTAHRFLVNFVITNCCIPIREVIDSVQQFRKELVDRNQTAANKSIKLARDKWYIVEHALSHDSLSRLPSDEGITQWLLKNRTMLEPELCSAILRSLGSVQYAESLNESQLEDLLSRLHRFLDSVETLSN